MKVHSCLGINGHSTAQREYAVLTNSAQLCYTLSNIGSLEGTLQYYYYATPGEPLQGYPGVLGHVCAHIKLGQENLLRIVK